MRIDLDDARAALAVGLRYRVLLNGIDVSMSARWCDPDAGLVCLVMRDHNGHAHHDACKGEVMQHVVSGVVQVALVAIEQGGNP